MCPCTSYWGVWPFSGVSGDSYYHPQLAPTSTTSQVLPSEGNTSECNQEI